MGCIKSKFVGCKSRLKKKKGENVKPENLKHAVLGTTMGPTFPDEFELAMFGMGCFWAAEDKFWVLDGVHSTQVGFSGAATDAPADAYAEVVRVVFDPNKISYGELLRVFWEGHDPTKIHRQNPEYRSAIFTYSDSQATEAEEYKAKYQQKLRKNGFDAITTEIKPHGTFHYASEDHQQFIHKNKDYKTAKGTGVCYLDEGTDDVEQDTKSNDSKQGSGSGSGSGSGYKADTSDRKSTSTYRSESKSGRSGGSG